MVEQLTVIAEVASYHHLCACIEVAIVQSSVSVLQSIKFQLVRSDRIPGPPRVETAGIPLQLEDDLGFFLATTNSPNTPRSQI